MNNRIIRWPLICSMFMVLLSLVIPFSTVSGQESNTMRVVPSSQDVRVGQKFTVDVVITAHEESAGAQCELFFDPELVQCEGFKEGDFFAIWAQSHGLTTMLLPQGTVDNDAGRVSTTAVLITGTNPAVQGPAGTGTFLTFEFTALKDGVCRFRLDPLATIVDFEGRDLPDLTFHDGQITIGGAKTSLPPTSDPTTIPQTPAKTTMPIAPTGGNNDGGNGINIAVVIGLVALGVFLILILIRVIRNRRKHA